MTPLNTVIGSHELCAWQPTRGVTWVQTRLPRHAERLSRRKDGKLVARGMAGGYLKIFVFTHSLEWARRLIARYELSEAYANARLIGAGTPPDAPESKTPPPNTVHSATGRLSRQ
jgi:hypothetical protein